MSEFTIRCVQQRPPYGYEERPIAAATAKEVLEYLFGTTRWKEEPEALRRRVAQWKQKLYADEPHAKGATRLGVIGATNGAIAPAAMPPADPANPKSYIYEDDEPWLQKALHLRVVHKRGWNNIADAVGRPRSTVQRVVRKTLAARGVAETE